MIKKTFIFGFIIATLLSLFAVSVSAATDGMYKYTVTNGKATITGVTSTSSFSGNQVVPSTLGGYPVTSIGRN